MNTKCAYCGQDIEEVSKDHEENGHNFECELRYELVDDNTMCEDCRDDILEDIFS